MRIQKLKERVDCGGIGLHTGTFSTISFTPAENGKIHFRKGDEIIAANHRNIVDTQRGVTLGNGNATVKTVEHLLAAIRWLGIAALEIRVEGEEVPIMDGSALSWVHLLKPHLEATSNIFEEKRMKRPINIEEGDASIQGTPDDHFSVCYTIDFPSTPIGKQTWQGKITPESFQNDLAPARTFGFLEEAASLQSRGLALGGNLETCVVVTKDSILTPLRFEDEMVKHKVLDFLGDLALVGFIPKMRFLVHKASHRLHISLVKKLDDGWN